MFARYSTGALIELAAAVAIFVAGVWLYRRRDKSDTYGSQGAVILFVVAAIMGIHAIGALNYHPSAAEAEYLQEHSR
ncbi:MAG: hypothetical protein HOP91_01320 [Sphingomonas sp.]|nr:hypothetical protein [Sphingomonas sp.]